MFHSFKYALHAAHQLLWTKRLGDVIVDAGDVEAEHLVDALRLGGDHDDRNMAQLRRGAQLLVNVPAINARHHQVQQHQIRLDLRNLIQTFLAPDSANDLKPVLAEDEFDQVDHFLFIFNADNLFHGGHLFPATPNPPKLRSVSLWWGLWCGPLRWKTWIAQVGGVFGQAYHMQVGMSIMLAVRRSGVGEERPVSVGRSSAVAYTEKDAQSAITVHRDFCKRVWSSFNLPLEETTMSKLNKYSARITQPRAQGASQAMLYGTGLTTEDMDKPQVGIASVWYEGNTCNMHLNDLAAQVKEGVVAAGLVGMRFNTIGVSDGISMGTDGMSYSLQSREIIADSIETVMSAHWYDANISIPGCDKNMPGCLIAMGRLNRPALMVYGGTIRAGCVGETKLDIVSAFQSYGEYLSGAISDEERQTIVRHSCPGPGACGGMYTANTMATAIEALGMALPYSSSTPATAPEKGAECFRAGAAIRTLLERDIKPRDIMTRAAFENALVIVMALGGSTNAVLHLVAMSRAVGVDLTLDDFQLVSDRVPYLANLKPSGTFVQEDLHAVGGTPGVMKRLLAAGLLDGDCLTVTGQTVAENLASLPDLAEEQTIVRPLANPMKATGHIQILRGNLAPDGAVAKSTG